MSYQFELDSTNRILRCRFDGRVTDEVLREFFRVAESYVALTDPQVGMVDLSAVTSFEVTSQTIRELANSPPPMREPSRPRFVVAPSANIFAMARMFQIHGEDTRPNLHVVHTPEEAWALLGVQETRFEAIQTN